MGIFAALLALLQRAPSIPVVAPAAPAPSTPSRAAAAMALAVPLVAQFEGCSLTAYHGAADKPGVWTIGFGSILIDGRPVREGDAITQAQADAMLADELAAKAAAVEKLAPADARACECAALYSFSYNEGIGAMQGSTLVRMWRAGDRTGAAAQFGNWIISDGKKVAGLVTRRATERDLFLGVSRHA